MAESSRDRLRRAGARDRRAHAAERVDPPRPGNRHLPALPHGEWPSRQHGECQRDGERRIGSGLRRVPGGFLSVPVVGYVSAANSAGDRLLVGNMSLTSGGNSLFASSFAELQALPLPAYKNQQFCGTVTLAPGYTAVAYVPTAAERAGDFNPFAGLLLDPLANNTPFPGGIIPASRLPSPMAWRIAANLTPSNDSTPLSDMK